MRSGGVRWIGTSKPGSLDPRAGDFRLVIAGRERLAVADPDPVEAVVEEPGRICRGERCGFGAERLPVAGLGQARTVLRAGISAGQLIWNAASARAASLAE